MKNMKLVVVETQNSFVHRYVRGDQKMLITIILLILFSLPTGCFYVNSEYLPEAMRFNTGDCACEMIPMSELDARARAFIAKESKVSESRLGNLRLSYAKYRTEKNAVVLRYFRGVAPEVLVYFDEKGVPYQVNYYK